MNRFKKPFMAVGLGLLVVSLASCGGSGDGTSGANEKESLIWGTSSQGSDVYVTSVSMADIVSGNTEIRTTVQSVGGSEATMRAIGDGNAQIGSGNMLAATSAFEGEEPFQEAVDVRLLIRGALSARQLIVRADSGIETPADLAGKRCACERPSLVELGMTTDALMDVYGVDPATVTIVPTNETNEAIDALRQGTVDAAMLPGGAGSSAFLELAENADVRWIDFSEKIDEVMQILGPAFSQVTIPSGTYKGQEQDVTTVALDMAVVASAELSDDVVYTLVKSILENTEKIQGPGAEEYTVEDTLASPPPLPFHPGAVRYYEESGAWTEELQKRQEELLG
jgi:TRAP transporter TAXI family solute receptor